jgi:hypothetical protein
MRPRLWLLHYIFLAPHNSGFLRISNDPLIAMDHKWKGLSADFIYIAHIGGHKYHFLSLFHDSILFPHSLFQEAITVCIQYILYSLKQRKLIASSILFFMVDANNEM